MSQYLGVYNEKMVIGEKGLLIIKNKEKRSRPFFLGKKGLNFFVIEFASVKCNNFDNQTCWSLNNLQFI